MSFSTQIFKNALEAIPTGVRWAAAGVFGTVLLGGIGLVSYNYYIHDKNCSEYESSVEDLLSKTTEKANRALSLAKVVEENPFAGFSVMGEMISIAQEIEKLSETSVDLRKEYESYCGIRRVDRFLGTDPINQQIEDLDVIGNRLRNM
jgi:hypothetical protein